MKNNNTLTLHENFFPGINKVKVSFFIYLDFQPQEAHTHTMSLCELCEYPNTVFTRSNAALELQPPSIKRRILRKNHQLTPPSNKRRITMRRLLE